MIQPQKPSDDTERVEALRALKMLDTPQEERYDRLVKRLAELLDVPIAYLALLDSDRQWLKSYVGDMQCEMDRDLSFCTQTILRDQPLIIPDTQRDPGFADHPLVTGEPHLRFYAGVPLSSGGHNVGTLCVADVKPRELSSNDLRTLMDFAVQVQEKMNLKPKAFISYSHLDEDWKHRLVGHMRVLQRQGLLDVWDDRRLAAGDEWRGEIQEVIESSNIAILLISANFLTSRFILDVEMPRILDRRDTEGMTIAPLIIKPCCWKQVTWLQEMNLRPKDGKALSGESDHLIDQYLADFGSEVLEISQGRRQELENAEPERLPVAATSASRAPEAHPGRKPTPPARPAPARPAPAPRHEIAAPELERSIDKDAPGNSLIVLPFADLSPERDLEYLCAGIAEELRHSLAGIEGLRLASRTSALQFKGRRADARVIGEQLGVDTVLEGTVRKAGTKLRISLRLIKTADGFQIWSERFNGMLDDVFALEEEIASSVARRLKPDSVPQAVSLVKPSTTDSEAHRLYLKGRHLWNQRTEESLKASAEYFQKAIERDPGYAWAYAGLTAAYTLLGIYGVAPPSRVMPRAKAAAKRALALDDGLSEVYACLGCVKATFDWSWPEAERDFERAIELDLEDATARHWYAINCLVPIGRFDAAIEQLDRAIILDPVSPMIRVTKGLQLYFAHRFEEAIGRYREAVELDPDFAMSRFFLGEAYAEVGEVRESIQEIETAIRSSGGSPQMTAGLAYAHALAGDVCEAQLVLGKLIELSEQRYVSPTLIARILTGMGDKGSALTALEEAVAARATDLAWLRVHPAFEPLRSEPRWIGIVERIGLGRAGLRQTE